MLDFEKSFMISLFLSDLSSGSVLLYATWTVGGLFLLDPINGFLLSLAFLGGRGITIYAGKKPCGTGGCSAWWVFCQWLGTECTC